MSMYESDESSQSIQQHKKKHNENVQSSLMPIEKLKMRNITLLIVLSTVIG